MSLLSIDMKTKVVQQTDTVTDTDTNTNKDTVTDTAGSQLLSKTFDIFYDVI